MPPALIALDLDGTAVRYEPQFELDPLLVDCLRDARRQGVGWLMNSDRWVKDMIKLAGRLDLDHRPVALLSQQQSIHILNQKGEYEPHAAWNEVQEKLRGELWREIQPFFACWEREIKEAYFVTNSFANETALAFCVPEEEVEDLREVMAEMLAPWPEAQISGNNEWGFVVHRDFSKGRLLIEAAQRLGVAASDILAIGDGLNDVSMLDGRVTPLVGCPASACPQAVEAVLSAGGFAARESGVAGTVAVIRHYLGG